LKFKKKKKRFRLKLFSSSLSNSQWIDPNTHSKIIEMCGSIMGIEKPERIQIKKLDTALTNEVYICKSPSNQKFLFRFYGVGTETFFNRKDEISNFQKLSKKGFGPKLLGIFENGRIEEFIESKQLTPEAMKEPRTSQEIAKLMSNLHQLFPNGNLNDLQIFNYLESWIPVADKSLQQLKFSEIHAIPSFLKLTIIEKELHELKSFYENYSQSPIVFCHNDVLSTFFFPLLPCPIFLYLLTY